MTNKSEMRFYRKDNGNTLIYSVSYTFYKGYAEVELDLIDVISDYSDDITVSDFSEDDSIDYCAWEYEQESLVECLKAEGYQEAWRSAEED